MEDAGLVVIALSILGMLGICASELRKIRQTLERQESRITFDAGHNHIR